MSCLLGGVAELGMTANYTSARKRALLKVELEEEQDV